MRRGVVNQRGSHEHCRFSRIMKKNSVRRDEARISGPVMLRTCKSTFVDTLERGTARGILPFRFRN